MSRQGSRLILGASNSTYINVTGGSDLLTGRPQNLCPPYKNTLSNLECGHRASRGVVAVLVCFYMVKKKPTWKGSAKVHSWTGSKQSKPIMY